jgi:8-oxo-dGTP pyrophosphatase MutT (NUDIX family)
MQFDLKLIEQIKLALNKPLPGEEAQYRMAPSYRPRLTQEQIFSHKPKVGGVMLLLYKKNDLLTTVLIKRKEYDGVHSGQMSFPGGKQDENDTDNIVTALRETHEEIGIEPSRIQVLGRLTELYIPPSNFLVYPSVGYTNTIEKFYPEASEVEKVVEIPVDFFLDEKNINLQTEVPVFNNTKVVVPAYKFDDHIIWGATAIILSEFTYILNQIRSNKNL